jgi:hypothetical protein
MAFLGGPSQTEITVGDLDVLDNGYVISPDGSNISITINDLSIELVFKYDDSGTKMESEVISDEALRLTLYNHGGDGVMIGGASPQVGPQETLSIGTMNNRELLLFYRVKTEYVDNNPTTISLYYNFYLGQEVDNSDLEERKK